MGHKAGTDNETYLLLDQGGYNEYPDLLMEGLFTAANEIGVQIIRIEFENEYNYEDESNQQKAVFRLIDRINPDGILFLGWIKALYGANMKDFRKRYSHISLYSLGLAIDDLPGNYVNGGKYVSAALSHLITYHNLKNIVFVPPYIPDDREETYKTFMKAHGLYKPELILERFRLKNRPSDIRGREVVSHIYDELRINPDSIFTMYNYEAMSILESLKARGVSIPDEVAVISYEDSRLAEYLTPTLTTIEYPWYQLGYQGLYHFHSNNKKSEPFYHQEIKTKLHVRASCGCTTPHLYKAESKKVRQFDKAKRIDVLQNILEELLQSTSLARDFIKTIKGESDSFVLDQIYIWIQSDDYFPPENTHRSFIKIRVLLDQIDLEYYKKMEIENFLLKIEFEFSERKRRLLGLKASNLTERIQKTHETTQEMITAFDFESMWDNFTNSLDKFEIPWAIVFLYKDTVNSVLEAVYQYHFPKGDQSVLSITLEELSKNQSLGSMLLYPIQVHTEELGVIVFGKGDQEHTTYRNLTVQLGTTLKSSSLVKDIKESVNQLSLEIKLRKEKEQDLASIATFDNLTGLLNRLSFYKNLEILPRKVEYFSLFFIDLDGFKPVNDLLGHETGDWLLKEMSVRIKRKLKNDFIKIPNDIDNHGDWPAFFRIGGDEFTLLIKEKENKSIANIASRLIKALEKPFYRDKQKIQISCSIGISCYPKDTTNSKDLVRYSDIAMYRAKGDKGTFSFFDKEIDIFYIDQLELEKELNKALEGEQITTYFQPCYSKSKDIMGFEALARWEHPTKGILNPDNFIHLLKNEKYNILLGNFLMKNALSQIGTWNEFVAGDYFLLINCLSKHMNAPGFKDYLLNLIKDSQLTPERIRISITELSLLEDKKNLFMLIQELREEGIKFAIDDYSKGTSALNFLQQVPKGTLFKVNRDYIGEIHKDKNNQQTLSNMLLILDKLNIPVVLSGVQDQEEIQCLDQIIKTNNNILLQGFYFMEPQTLNNLKNLL